ncbi:1-deoxy-D-xylulose-5-phosphate reductoisomerase [Aestuariimicrobium sp. Y1814]|uniref:1-deoxy-D-xylulose-5-phosphate reductoisomerase n=1 Tax=Aestuariimicrobium sp. Y1814 TaxID=3418742 RepID=UPI003DA6E962
MTCHTWGVADQRNVIILGSTGSIGTQAVDVISTRRDQFRVTGLSAGGSDIPTLAAQVLELAPEVVALARPTVVQDLQLALYAEASKRGWNKGDVVLPRIIAGPDASTELAAMPADVVLNGITGSAGLLPTLATLAAGTTLALANKESLVIGGRLVTGAAAPDQIVAVDSEHSAFAQALRAGRKDEVRRLILTASGGPFRGRRRDELTEVTPEQAMAHPTWAMGRVITINSSTLVNKGLELLEAGLLYDVPLDDVVAVVHPQSIVHSMVEFHDGSTIAQVSPPDMRLPIGLGLTWPDRMAEAARPNDWTQAATWTFEPLDNEAFPAVDLARHCGKLGGSAPAVFNAANEECVDAFCEGRLSFLGIVDTVAEVVADHVNGMGDGHLSDDQLSVEGVLAADAWARTRAGERIARGANA